MSISTLFSPSPGQSVQLAQSAVAGAMLFGAATAADAAPAPAPQMVGLAHVAPAAWHRQPPTAGPRLRPWPPEASAVAPEASAVAPEASAGDSTTGATAAASAAAALGPPGWWVSLIRQGDGDAG